MDHRIGNLLHPGAHQVGHEPGGDHNDAPEPYLPNMHGSAFLEPPPGGHRTGSALDHILNRSKATVVNALKAKPVMPPDQNLVMCLQQICASLTAMSQDNGSVVDEEGKLLDISEQFGQGRI